MKLKKESLINAIMGIAIGLVNGFLGAGGGMVAVPFLKKTGMQQKTAHANAVAIILPISIMSAVLYLVRGDAEFSQSLQYIPWGLLGAVLGTFLLKKISPLWLKRIFGCFMIYAGVRLLVR